MQNKDYWKKRFELLEDSSNKKSKALTVDIENQYIKAQRAIEGKLQSWYGRFATNNNITMGEARKLLTTKELAEFKWDVNEYIKYGQTNALNGIWMHELENASARFHISRLEALKIQTQQAVEVLYGNQLDSLDKLARNIYTEGYYHSAYEIQKGFNVGYDIASIDNNKLDKIISKPWAADGKNFSERIWNNRSGLVSELNTQMTQTVMLGKAPDDAIKAISKKFNTSKNNAGKLIMTESAYFASASQKDCFNDLDVEKFEVVATLDSHTSAICQELDGHIFNMKDFEAGVTAPPFHVWCRTCTVPYFEDNFGERAARDEDGKTYYVPSDMKYPDWKTSFVDGGSKEGLKVINSDTKLKNNVLKDSESGILEERKKYINACDKVLEKGKQNNKENLLVLDKKGNELLNLDGESSSVTFTPEMMNLLKNSEKDSVLLIHNHPMSSSFSDADICVLNRFNSIAEITAYGHDNTLYTLKTNGNIVDSATIKKEYQNIRNMEFNKYRDQVVSGKLDQNKAWKEHSNEIMQVMSKKYGWEYKRGVLE